MGADTPPDSGQQEEQAQTSQQEAQNDSQLQTQQPDQPVPGQDAAPDAAQDAQPTQSPFPSNEEQQAAHDQREDDRIAQTDEHRERLASDSDGAEAEQAQPAESTDSGDSAQE